MRFSFFHILLAILLFSSCTIEKRTFNKGYYVSWNKNSKKTITKHEDILPREKVISAQSSPEIILTQSDPAIDSSETELASTDTIIADYPTYPIFSIKTKPIIHSPEKIKQGIKKLHEVKSPKKSKTDSHRGGQRSGSDVALVLLIIAGFMIVFGISCLLFPWTFLALEILALFLITLGFILLMVALLAFLISLAFGAIL